MLRRNTPLPHPHDTLIEKEHAVSLVGSQVSGEIRVNDNVDHRKPRLVVRPLVVRGGTRHHQGTCTFFIKKFPQLSQKDLKNTSNPKGRKLHTWSQCVMARSAGLLLLWFGSRMICSPQQRRRAERFGRQATRGRWT